MDYTVDSFQTMFTNNQAALVRGVMANQRSGLVGSTTSVQHAALLPSTVIYPNPASSFIQLKQSEKISNVNVADIFGRSVINLSGAEANSMKYDVSGLAAGNYILQIETENGARSVGKFSIVR